GPVADAGRPGNPEFLAAAFAPGVEDEERKAKEVVPVKVTDEDALDLVRRHARAAHLLQRRRPAVEEVSAVQQEGAKGPGLVAEGVARPEEQQFHAGTLRRHD